MPDKNDDLYSGFSNYEEINSNSRSKVANVEAERWGEQKEEYVKYRKEWKRAAEQSYVPTIPLHVDIELADVCNLRCEMCAHGLGTVNKTGFMKQELVDRLISECADLGVSSIKFNWRGEASLNSYLPAAIKLAKEKGILEVAINTNGLPKKKQILIDCGKAGLDRIIFSIDGHSKSTFETIRKGGNYAQLLENVNEFLAWKSSEGLEKPFVRVQMVRSVRNMHEVDEFIKYWSPKVDDVRISDVMDRGQGASLSVGDQIVKGRNRCPQPFQRLTVGRDGTVVPCCADWNEIFPVGDVNKESLKNIWRGYKMEAVRSIQEQRKLDDFDLCKNCYVKESYLWEKK